MISRSIGSRDLVCDLVPMYFLSQRACQNQFLGIDLVMLCKRTPDRHVLRTRDDEAVLVPRHYANCGILGGQLFGLSDAGVYVSMAPNAPARHSR